MAHMPDDDDAPPPLSSLSEQVEALRIRQQAGAEASSSRSQAPQEQLRVASCTVAEDRAAQVPVQAPSKQTIKKGFFDTKPAAKKAAGTHKAGAIAADSMPMLKAQKPAMPGMGPHIPDFLRVEPDENEKKYAEMRTKLVDALKPTPDTIASISKDPLLMTAFDDPEVMAAVNDIARNPENFKKHQHNKKVIAFYQAMGGMMGQKLEAMGDQQPGAKTGKKA